MNRQERLLQLYRQGLTLEHLGQELGLSHQRVNQLLRELGLPAKGRQERRAAWLAEHHGEAIVASFLERRDDEQVAGELGLTPPDVRRVVDLLVPDAQVLRRKYPEQRLNYTNEELIEALRAAAVELPSPMGHAEYRDWALRNRTADGRPRPGYQTMFLRWGSWRAALAAAGLPARPRTGGTSALTHEVVVAAVVACWHDLGRPPTRLAYEAWAAGHPDRPSSASVRKLIGSWDEVLVPAWEIVHGISLPRSTA